MDPSEVFAGFVGVLMLVTGFDLGIAFLMRGQREAGGWRRDD